ncbi:hypothetical protein BC332_07090 [Capsicum chinense]|nr:hypothetical protein BC332_07090 [Capsicum chinense]
MRRRGKGGGRGHRRPQNQPIAIFGSSMSTLVSGEASKLQSDGKAKSAMHTSASANPRILGDQRISRRLVETKVKQAKVGVIMKHSDPSWMSFNNYSHAENGKIWVLWDLKFLEVVDVYPHGNAVSCQYSDLTNVVSSSPS